MLIPRYVMHIDFSLPSWRSGAPNTAGGLRGQGPEFGFLHREPGMTNGDPRRKSRIIPAPARNRASRSAFSGQPLPTTLSLRASPLPTAIQRKRFGYILARVRLIGEMHAAEKWARRHKKSR